MRNEDDGRRAPTLRERILEVMGPEWMTSWDVAAALGSPDPTTVGHNLRVMALTGSVEAYQTNRKGKTFYCAAGAQPALPDQGMTAADRIMNVLGAEWMTTREVQGAAHRSEKCVRHNLKRLVEEGLVEKSAAVVGGHFSLVYRRAGSRPASTAPIRSRAEAVMGVLGPEWMTAMEIQASVPNNIPMASVRYALHRAVSEGRAEEGRTVKGGRSLLAYRLAGAGP